MSRIGLGYQTQGFNPNIGATGSRLNDQMSDLTATLINNTSPGTMGYESVPGWINPVGVVSALMAQSSFDSDVVEPLKAYRSDYPGDMSSKSIDEQIAFFSNYSPEFRDFYEETGARPENYDALRLAYGQWKAEKTATSAFEGFWSPVVGMTAMVLEAVGDPTNYVGALGAKTAIEAAGKKAIKRYGARELLKIAGSNAALNSMQNYVQSVSAQNRAFELFGIAPDPSVDYSMAASGALFGAALPIGMAGLSHSAKFAIKKGVPLAAKAIPKSWTNTIAKMAGVPVLREANLDHATYIQKRHAEATTIAGSYKYLYGTPDGDTTLNTAFEVDYWDDVSITGVTPKEYAQWLLNNKPSKEEAVNFLDGLQQEAVRLRDSAANGGENPAVSKVHRDLTDTVHKIDNAMVEMEDPEIAKRGQAWALVNFKKSLVAGGAADDVASQQAQAIITMIASYASHRNMGTDEWIARNISNFTLDKNPVTGETLFSFKADHGTASATYWPVIDFSNIGSGEGTRWEGWGLYLTDVPGQPGVRAVRLQSGFEVAGVATFYRDTANTNNSKRGVQPEYGTVRDVSLRDLMLIYGDGENTSAVLSKINKIHGVEIPDNIRKLADEWDNYPPTSDAAFSDLASRLGSAMQDWFDANSHLKFDAEAKKPGSIRRFTVDLDQEKMFTWGRKVSQQDPSVSIPLMDMFHERALAFGLDAKELGLAVLRFSEMDAERAAYLLSVLRTASESPLTLSRHSDPTGRRLRLKDEVKQYLLGQSSSLPMVEGGVDSFNPVPHFGNELRHLSDTQAKQLSMDLKERGIAGWRYAGSKKKGDYWNYVIWDESVLKDQEVFYQKNKGGTVQAAVSFSPKDGRAIIRAFSGATNFSSLVHEVGHIFRRDMDPELRKTADEFVGAKPNEKWTVPQEEKFARAFEKWIRTRKTGTTVIEKVFQSMQNWMKQIYTSIRGSELDHVRLTDDVEAMFELMFQKTQDAAPAGSSSIRFTTAKGSVYEFHDDGTTTRNKKARPEHPGDSGPKPRSKKTWFVSSDEVDNLAEVQHRGAEKLVLRERTGPDGKKRLVVEITEGPNKGEVWNDSTFATIHDKPAIGLIPVEQWGDDSVHFGNKITSIDTATPSTGPLVPRYGLGRVKVRIQGDIERALIGLHKTKTAKDRYALMVYLREKTGMLDNEILTASRFMYKELRSKIREAKDKLRDTNRPADVKVSTHGTPYVTIEFGKDYLSRVYDPKELGAMKFKERFATLDPSTTISRLQSQLEDLRKERSAADKTNDAAVSSDVRKRTQAALRKLNKAVLKFFPQADGKQVAAEVVGDIEFGIVERTNGIKLDNTETARVMLEAGVNDRLDSNWLVYHKNKTIEGLRKLGNVFSTGHLETVGSSNPLIAKLARFVSESQLYRDAFGPTKFTGFGLEQHRHRVKAMAAETINQVHEVMKNIPPQSHTVVTKIAMAIASGANYSHGITDKAVLEAANQVAGILKKVYDQFGVEGIQNAYLRNVLDNYGGTFHILGAMRRPAELADALFKVWKDHFSKDTAAIHRNTWKSLKALWGDIYGPGGPKTLGDLVPEHRTQYLKALLSEEIRDGVYTSGLRREAQLVANNKLGYTELKELITNDSLGFVHADPSLSREINVDVWFTDELQPFVDWDIYTSIDKYFEGTGYRIREQTSVNKLVKELLGYDRRDLDAIGLITGLRDLMLVDSSLPEYQRTILQQSFQYLENQVNTLRGHVARDWSRTMGAMDTVADVTMNLGRTGVSARSAMAGLFTEIIPMLMATTIGSPRNLLPILKSTLGGLSKWQLKGLVAGYNHMFTHRPDLLNSVANLVSVNHSWLDKTFINPWKQVKASFLTPDAIRSKTGQRLTAITAMMHRAASGLGGEDFFQKMSSNIAVLQTKFRLVERFNDMVALREAMDKVDWSKEADWEAKFRELAEANGFKDHPEWAAMLNQAGLLEREWLENMNHMNTKSGGKLFNDEVNGVLDQDLIERLISQDAERARVLQDTNDTLLRFIESDMRTRVTVPGVQDSNIPRGGLDPITKMAQMFMSFQRSWFHHVLLNGVSNAKAVYGLSFLGSMIVGEAIYYHAYRMLYRGDSWEDIESEWEENPTLMMTEALARTNLLGSASSIGQHMLDLFTDKGGAASGSIYSLKVASNSMRSIFNITKAALTEDTVRVEDARRLELQTAGINSWWMRAVMEATGYESFSEWLFQHQRATDK
jgi:hypothetical protein